MKWSKHLVISMLSLVVLFLMSGIWMFIEIGDDFVDRDRLVARIVCPTIITLSCCIFAYCGALHNDDNEEDDRYVYDDQSHPILYSNSS